jgi:hypothetical protein
VIVADQRAPPCGILYPSQSHPDSLQLRVDRIQVEYYILGRKVDGLSYRQMVLSCDCATSLVALLMACCNPYCNRRTPSVISSSASMIGFAKFYNMQTHSRVKSTCITIQSWINYSLFATSPTPRFAPLLLQFASSVDQLVLEPAKQPHDRLSPPEL